MEFSFDQLLSLGMFFVAVISVAWGIVKFFNSQTHARISKVESDLKHRIDQVEENAASRQELSQAVDSIKEIVKGTRDEQHRMATRLDDLFKWLMEKKD